jgi:hypothetical protein
LLGLDRDDMILEAITALTYAVLAVCVPMMSGTATCRQLAVLLLAQFLQLVM